MTFCCFPIGISNIIKLSNNIRQFVSIQSDLLQETKNKLRKRILNMYLTALFLNQTKNVYLKLGWVIELTL